MGLDKNNLLQYRILKDELCSKIRSEVSSLNNELNKLYSFDYKLMKNREIENADYHKEVYIEIRDTANKLKDNIDNFESIILNIINEKEGTDIELDDLGSLKRSIEIVRLSLEQERNTLINIAYRCEDMLNHNVYIQKIPTLNEIQRLRVSMEPYPYSYLFNRRGKLTEDKIDINKKHFKKAGLDIKDIEEFVYNLMMMLNYTDGYDNTVFNKYMDWMYKMGRLVPPFTLNIFAIKRKKEQNRKELKALLDLYKPKQSTKQQTDLVEIQTVE